MWTYGVLSHLLAITQKINVKESNISIHYFQTGQHSNLTAHLLPQNVYNSFQSLIENTLKVHSIDAEEFKSISIPIRHKNMKLIYLCESRMNMFTKYMRTQNPVPKLAFIVRNKSEHTHIHTCTRILSTL